MNRIPKIMIFSILITYQSYSQKVLKEYYDYFKTRIKEELQVNSYGLGNGYYKSYYQRGGFKETGFYTNGKKSGLWSYYAEGATKPYEQWKFDKEGRKLMYKVWYQGGPNIGKLWEWQEWSQEETDYNGNPLVAKHVLYTDKEVDENYYAINFNTVPYYLLYDLELRRYLPREKRYFKEYYSTGKIRHQWIVTKKGEIIETWYDESGSLTRRMVEDSNGQIISTNDKNNSDKKESYIVLQETYLYRNPGKDTILKLKKGSALKVNPNDQENFSGLDLTKAAALGKAVDQENPLFPGSALTEFYKVSFNEKKGYVYAKDLSLAPNYIEEAVPISDNSKNIKKYKVDVTTFLYNEPNFFSSVLTQVEPGTEIMINSDEANKIKDFIKITYRKWTGYVYIKILQPL